MNFLVLRSRSLLTKVLTKTRDGWHKADYGGASKFQVEPRAVSSFDELAAALDEIKHDPHAMIVRGPLSEAGRTALKADPKAWGLRRKIASKSCPNPWFEEGAVQWEMIDHDNLPTDGIDYIAEPECFVRHTIQNHLPKAYHGVSCWWQFSSSAGTKEGVTGLHLFFWHHAPVSTLELREWSKAERPSVDPAPYQAVQPHYTARPVFNNCPDPMPRRDGVLRGAVDTVELPPFNNKEVRKKVREKTAKAKRQKRATGGHRRCGAVASDVAGALALLGDGEALAGFHGPLRDGIYHWVRITHPAHRKWKQFKARLRRAALEAPCEGDRARVRARTSDAYLDGLYLSAREKLDGGFGEAPTAPTKGVSLAEAEGGIRAAVKRVLDAEEPMAQAVLATVGSGKTELAFQEIASSGDWKVKRIHMYVPTNRLAVELRERARKAGISKARVHRGQISKTPGIRSLCRKVMHPLVELVGNAGGDVKAIVCGQCEFQNKCQWIAQTQDTAPGLVIMPQEYAWMEKAERAHIQIFDESFWQKGLRRSKISLEVFHRQPHVPKRDGTGHDLGAEDSLDKANRRLLEALDDWDGTTWPLIVAGLSVAIAKSAMAANYQRHNVLTTKLGKAPKSAWGKLIAKHQKDHATAKAEAEIWRVIAKELELFWDGPSVYLGTLPGMGELTTPAERTMMGLSFADDVLYSQRRADLKAPDIPTLVLDATGKEEVLKAYFPKIEVEPIQVDAPHQTIIQVDDKQLGKASIAPSEDDTPAEAGKKARNIVKLERLLEVAKAQHGAGKVGLTTYKATEEALDLDGIIHGHFGDIAGKDGFKDVALHITVGRPEPTVFVTERSARALWFDSPDPLELTGAWGEVDDWRWSADGEAIRCQRRAHPDPRVDAVRRQVTTAALMQSDRTRGVRRTAKNPVTWLVLCNEPLPIPVNEFAAIEDIWPTNFEVAVSRGAASWNYRHMVAMHPDLWPTESIARHDMTRGGWPGATEEVGPIPYNVTSYKGMGPTSEPYIDRKMRGKTRVFEYRMPGPGQKPAKLIAHDEKAAREYLAKVGEVAVLTEEVPDWDQIPMLLVESDDVWKADPIGRITVTKPQLSCVTIAHLAAMSHPPSFRRAAL